jgi:hypothetical protein
VEFMKTKPVALSEAGGRMSRNPGKAPVSQCKSFKRKTEEDGETPRKPVEGEGRRRRAAGAGDCQPGLESCAQDDFGCTT